MKSQSLVKNVLIFAQIHIQWDWRNNSQVIWDGFRPSSNPSFSVGIYPFGLRLGDRTGNMLSFTGQCNNLHTLLYLVSLLHILLYLKSTFWKQAEFNVLRASLGTSYVAYAHFWRNPRKYLLEMHWNPSNPGGNHIWATEFWEILC